MPVISQPALGFQAGPAAPGPPKFVVADVRAAGGVVSSVSPSSLPTVKALDALWQEVAKKPLWAPPHFWRYLALRWRMRLRLMDPEQVRIAAPAGKVNDCSACFDLCCVGARSTVLLRLRDIATLVDIGRSELMTHAKPSFDDEDTRQRPALGRHLASDAWNAFPVLRQNEFRACAALTAEGKCSLYPHWPMSCARFPYSLHLEDEEVFYSKRCDAFWIRPDACDRVRAMRTAAVASYNERIKDAILLAYAPTKIEALGLVQYLSPLGDGVC